jgi:uncharacterized protein YdeI (BOF family)
MTKLIMTVAVLASILSTTNAFAQSAKKHETVKQCQIHVLWQGGNPTATTVKVCG